MVKTVVISVLLLVAAGVGSGGADAGPTEPQRGWLGVTTEDLSPAMRAALGIKCGVLVAAALDSGPAGRYGLRTGDVILELDGHSIDGGADLRTAVRHRAGKKVSLRIWRQGRVRLVNVTLGSRDPGRPETCFDLHPVSGAVVRTFRKALLDIRPRLEDIVETELIPFDSLRAEIEELRRELRELREQLQAREKEN